MSKTVIIAIAFVVAVIVAIVYSTLGLRRHRVEVCMTFNGRTECRAAAGATRQEALRTATENACALLASGMTESIACGNTPPAKVRWLE